MQNNPKISIIVPVYNAEKYIKRCMDSIYAQTLTDYEIILVNDGSKDNSLFLCREYAKNDKRVKVIDKENGGAGSARNAGIEVARGEYLAFPDADDWFDSNMYAELYTIAKSGDFDVVFSGVNYYEQGYNGEMVYSRSANVKELRYFTKQECRENVMEFFPTSTIFDVPWNKIYKRETANEYGIRFTNLRRCQDATFNIDFYNCVKKVASTDKAYYNYMENTQSGVWKKFPKNYVDITIFYYTHLKEILDSWGMYREDIKLHYDTSFVISLYGTFSFCDNPNWGMSKEEKREYVAEIMSRESVKEFLAVSTIRDQAKEQFDIIVNQDVKGFFKLHKKEVFKEKLRQNKFLMKIYRLLKR